MQWAVYHQPLLPNAGYKYLHRLFPCRAISHSLSPSSSTDSLVQQTNCSVFWFCMLLTNYYYLLWQFATIIEMCAIIGNIISRLHDKAVPAVADAFRARLRAPDRGRRRLEQHGAALCRYQRRGHTVSQQPCLLETCVIELKLSMILHFSLACTF